MHRSTAPPRPQATTTSTRLAQTHPSLPRTFPGQRHSSSSRSRPTRAPQTSDSNQLSYDIASTAASSYIETDIKVAGPSGFASELSNNAAKARQEEQLGRPEIQVTELTDAVQDGLDLDGTNDAESDDDVAQGFENSAPHIVLQATVTESRPPPVTVTPPPPPPHTTLAVCKKKSLWSIDSVQIPYSHLVYALGSHLPDPLRHRGALQGRRHPLDARNPAARQGFRRDRPRRWRRSARRPVRHRHRFRASRQKRHSHPLAQAAPAQL